MTYAPVRVFTNMLLADKFNGSSMLRNMAFDVKKNMHRGNLLVSPKRLFVLRASSAQAAARSKKFRWDKTPMVIMRS